MGNTNKRRALGRGLSSLIPIDERESEKAGVVVLDRETLHVNPFQPRRDFDEEEIRGLAESIRAQGLLQPIIVRKKANGYEVASGERRLRALKILGETSVPCIIRQRVTDREMLEIALVENIQREDLNEIEKARAYDRLLVECSLSHEQLSERIGKSRSAVTNALRLLKLPESIQEMVRGGGLSMGHARALLAIADPKRQQKLAEKIVRDGLSVREVEKAAQGAARARGKKGGAQALDPDLQQIIEKLQYRFGTAVSIISRAKGGGRVEICFYGNDDLNRILDIMLA